MQLNSAVFLKYNLLSQASFKKSPLQLPDQIDLKNRSRKNSAHNVPVSPVLPSNQLQKRNSSLNECWRKLQETKKDETKKFLLQKKQSLINFQDYLRTRKSCKQVSRQYKLVTFTDYCIDLFGKDWLN